MLSKKNLIIGTFLFLTNHLIACSEEEKHDESLSAIAIFERSKSPLSIHRIANGCISHEHYFKEHDDCCDEIFKYLDENPSIINKPDKYGMTLTHLAVLKRKPSLVKYLVTHGADLSIRSKRNAIGAYSVTPLRFALHIKEEPEKIMAIYANCPGYPKDYYGMTSQYNSYKKIELDEIIGLLEE